MYELSEDIRQTSIAVACLSSGYSIFEKAARDGQSKARLAQASLVKKDNASDIIFSLKRLDEWLSSSVTDRQSLAKEYGLKVATMERMNQLYIQIHMALTDLFPRPRPTRMDQVEVIGRAFAQIFPDKVAEYLIPAHPEAGIYFPSLKLLSRLSLDSALSIPSKDTQFLLALRLSYHENEWKAHMCHALLPEWLPGHLLHEFASNQKFESCFSQANLHHSVRDAVIRALKSEPNHDLIHVAYDPSRLVLTAYCPRSSVSTSGALIKRLLEQHTQSLEHTERDVSLGSDRIVSIRSGFVVSNLDTGLRKVELYAPSHLSTFLEFESWLLLSLNLSKSDIEHFFFAGTRNRASLSASTLDSSETLSKASFVIFKSAHHAQALRQYLLRGDVAALSGAKLAFDTKEQQYFCIEVKSSAQNLSHTRSFIEDRFPNAIIEIDPQSSNSASDSTILLVYSSSLSQAQTIVDALSTNHAICSQKVLVPPRFASLYAPALASLSSSMASFSPNIDIIPSINSIRITGTSVREVSRASRALHLALAPTHLNLTGAWKMFYSEWHWRRLSLTQPNVTLEIRTTQSAAGPFPSSVTLYGSQLDQAQAINEITSKFAQFVCQTHDVSTVKHHFAPTRAGGAELSHIFSKSPIGKSVRHRVDLISGTIFVYVPFPKANSTPYIVKATDLQQLNNAVAAVAARYTSAHNDHLHPVASTKCCFCADSDPDGESSLCGHRFCTPCLVREASNKLGPICCSYCSQVIPIRHFPQVSLRNMLKSSLRYALENAPQGTNSVSSPISVHLQLAQTISFCPNPECDRVGARPAASSSYSKCEDCGVMACSLCGTCNQSLHENCTCAEFGKKMQENSVTKHLEALFVSAEKFADSSVDVSLGRVVERIRNPSLQRGCPAVLRFVRGLLAKGGVSMLSQVIFAWHGTNYSAIPSICEHGFDPNRRSGQAYGIGEYFGITAVTSSGYARPSTLSNVILLAALLQVPETSVNRGTPFCHIVNNPLHWTHTYCIPLLVVRFSGSTNHRSLSIQADLKFNTSAAEVPFSFLAPPELPNLSSSSASSSLSASTINTSVFYWRWRDDNGPVSYSSEHSLLLETAYHAFHGGSQAAVKVQLSSKRLNDGIIGNYEVDISKMKQFNLKTNYTRSVERILVPLVAGKPQWMFKGNVWLPFDAATDDIIEKNFVNYRAGHPAMVTFQFPGRADQCKIDFINMNYSNISNQSIVTIRRDVK